MAIKASFFEIHKDIDLPLGAIVVADNGWFMRVQMEEYQLKHELLLALTGDEMGETKSLGRPARCVAVSPSLQLEVRLDGPVEGPSTAPVGALVWSVEGTRQAVHTKFAVAVTMDGRESNDFPSARAFYAKRWSVWAVDASGKALTEGPLFAVKID